MNNLTKTRNRTFIAGNSAPTARAGAVQTCSSCGGSTIQSTAVARYDENGDCAPLGQISCETQWQMRDCLKVALCEFLFCMADEYCKDGTFKVPVEVDENGVETEKEFGDILGCCLGNALCSALHCLPNAICGPRQNNDCVPPPPALECNFAVEEKN